LLVGSANALGVGAGGISSTVSSSQNLSLEKASGGSIGFYQSGVVTSVIEDVSSQGGLRFYTGTGGSVSERMRILATGNILSLAGGSTSATGTGIAFPSTQSASSDANTLDDYEEGTWTPALQGSSTAGTYTYDTDRTGGNYTKIGNTVFIRGVIRVSGTTSAGSGSAQITGLPFATINPDTSWGRIPSSLAVQSGPTLANSSIFVTTEGASTTYLTFGIQGTASWTAATVAQVATTDSIWFFQLQYNVS
jgi:hypothetical protein